LNVKTTNAQAENPLTDPTHKHHYPRRNPNLTRTRDVYIGHVAARGVCDWDGENQGRVGGSRETEAEASEHGGPHVLDASAQKKAWRHPENVVLHVCTTACMLEEACIS